MTLSTNAKAGLAFAGVIGSAASILAISHIQKARASDGDNGGASATMTPDTVAASHPDDQIYTMRIQGFAPHEWLEVQMIEPIAAGIPASTEANRVQVDGSGKIVAGDGTKAELMILKYAAEAMTSQFVNLVKMRYTGQTSGRVAILTIHYA